MARQYTVTLSSKGQLTLPHEIRRELDINRGARLRLVIRTDGTIELSKPRFQHVAEIAGIGRIEGEAPSETLSEMRDMAYVERWKAKQERSQ